MGIRTNLELPMNVLTLVEVKMLTNWFMRLGLNVAEERQLSMRLKGALQIIDWMTFAHGPGTAADLSIWQRWTLTLASLLIQTRHEVTCMGISSPLRMYQKKEFAGRDVVVVCLTIALLVFIAMGTHANILIPNTLDLSVCSWGIHQILAALK